MPSFFSTLPRLCFNVLKRRLKRSRPPPERSSLRWELLPPLHTKKFFDLIFMSTISTSTHNSSLLGLTCTRASEILNLKEVMRVPYEEDLEIDLDDVPVLTRGAVVPAREKLKMVDILTDPGKAPVGLSVATVVKHADVEKLFDFKKTRLTAAQQLYIMCYSLKGTKRGACQLADCSYKQVADWMRDEEFVDALGNAVEMVGDTLEGELIRRAMEGSDKLLLRAIEAHKPEKYNQKINVDARVVHSWADLARQVMDEELKEESGDA